MKRTIHTVPSKFKSSFYSKHDLVYQLPTAKSKIIKTEFRDDHMIDPQWAAYQLFLLFWFHFPVIFFADRSHQCSFSTSTFLGCIDVFLFKAALSLKLRSCWWFWRFVDVSNIFHSKGNFFILQLIQKITCSFKQKYWDQSQCSQIKQSTDVPTILEKLPKFAFI